MYAFFPFSSSPYASAGDFTPTETPATVQSSPEEPQGSLTADSAEGSSK